MQGIIDPDVIESAGSKSGKAHVIKSHHNVGGLPANMRLKLVEPLHKHDLYDQTSQAFAVFLPVRSVGVMGDGRRHDDVVSLRAVETVDFMTAHWVRLPYDFLDLVSRRIVNEVKGISRVVYDISGKPPATIEWE